VTAAIDLSWLDFETEINEVHSLTETIEIIMIVSREAYLSVAEFRGLFPLGNQPTDAEITLAFAEVAERRRIIGRLYPFKRNRRGIEFDATTNWQVYGMLLLLSFKNMPTRTDATFRASDPIFDEVVLRAAIKKQGHGARGVVFGWPVRGGRPAHFPAALKWAADRLGVKLRMAEADLPVLPKDGGVDVIVWSPFKDGRLGFPVMLMQNTVQFAFADKPRDVSADRWRDWINFGTTPTVGFAIPFSVRRGHEWWDEVTAETSMFLDRIRILEQFRREDPTKWPEWSAIETFVANEIDALLDAASSSGTTVRPAGARKKRKKQP
jgi:hypothetical protein